MADICDIAQDHIDQEAPLLLAASKRPVGPKPCGACHNCGEEVSGVAVFCDTHCRDDYERVQRAKAQRPVME